MSILPSVPNVEVHTTLVNQALNSFEKCTKLDKTYYKGWHHWAVANFELVETLKQRFEAEKQRGSSRQSSPTNAAAATTTSSSASGPNDSSNARKARYQQQYSEQQRAKMREQRSQRRQRDFKNHIRNAAEGFFRSIVLGRARSKSNVLQDILRLLTLWFSHGGGVDLQVRASLAVHHRQQQKLFSDALCWVIMFFCGLLRDVPVYLRLPSFLASLTGNLFQRL